MASRPREKNDRDFRTMNAAISSAAEFYYGKARNDRQRRAMIVEMQRLFRILCEKGKMVVERQDCDKGAQPCGNGFCPDPLTGCKEIPPVT